MFGLLTTSKSLIDTRPTFNNNNEPKLERHFSVSLIDSIPKIEPFSSNSISSSTLSDISIVSLSASLSSTSSQSLCSNHSNSSPIQTATTSSPDKTKKLNRKKSKWKNVTKELALFQCKRNQDNNLYFVNKINDNEEDDKHMDDLVTNQQDEDEDETFSKKLIRQRNRLNPKEITLKKLIKTNDIKSIKKFYFLNCKSSFKKKKNCKKLYLKYHLYKIIENYFYETFVSILNRCRHVYALKRIDETRCVNKEFLIENKTMFKSLRVADRLLNDSRSELERRQIDPPVVVNYSLDHNRVNEELNQNYDDMYLEFLISLQHRDITPEDYEYLSRLDELVKKKTINQNTLEKLKTETIDEEILKKIEKEQEVCGICLDNYSIGQVRKHLPCGHKFHSECVDNWLKSHSTNCPLDNLPIDDTNIDKQILQRLGSFYSQEDFHDFDHDHHHFESETENDQIIELIDFMVDKIEKEIDLDNEVNSVMSNLVDSVVNSL